jgi:hypothetical protein
MRLRLVRLELLEDSSREDFRRLMKVRLRTLIVWILIGAFRRAR